MNILDGVPEDRWQEDHKQVFVPRQGGGGALCYVTCFSMGKPDDSHLADNKASLIPKMYGNGAIF